MLNLDNDIIEMIINISHEIHHLEQQHYRNIDEGLTPTKDEGTWLRRLSMFRKEVR